MVVMIMEGIILIVKILEKKRVNILIVMELSSNIKLGKV